jgi:hypothetical protein
VARGSLGIEVWSTEGARIVMGPTRRCRCGDTNQRWTDMPEKIKAASGN